METMEALAPLFVVVAVLAVLAWVEKRLTGVLDRKAHERTVSRTMARYREQVGEREAEERRIEAEHARRMAAAPGRGRGEVLQELLRDGDYPIWGAELLEERKRRRLTREERREVYERDGGACVECGGTFDLQYDHIIPFSQGGACSVDNMQLLCGECNQRKGNRYVG